MAVSSLLGVTDPFEKLVEATGQSTEKQGHEHKCACTRAHALVTVSGLKMPPQAYLWTEAHTPQVKTLLCKDYTSICFF